MESVNVTLCGTKWIKRSPGTLRGRRAHPDQRTDKEMRLFRYQETRVLSQEGGGAGSTHLLNKSSEG